MFVDFTKNAVILCIILLLHTIERLKYSCEGLLSNATKFLGYIQFCRLGSVCTIFTCIMAFSIFCLKCEIVIDMLQIKFWGHFNWYQLIVYVKYNTLSWHDYLPCVHKWDFSHEIAHKSHYTFHNCQSFWKNKINYSGVVEENIVILSHGGDNTYHLYKYCCIDV